MITLSQGLKNSLIVLEHLRNNEELQRLCDISVGAFTNCREVGLTFAVLGYYDVKGEHITGSMNDAFTYCVYEHRNSDEIIINGKSGYVSMSGDLPYNEGTKYDYLASFSYNKHYECAEKLANMILKAREKYIKSNKLETSAI